MLNFPVRIPVVKAGDNGNFCVLLRKSELYMLYKPVRDIKKRILQFTNLKCCIKAKEPFKTPFNGALVLIYYFKKHSKPCFFILKTF